MTTRTDPHTGPIRHSSGAAHPVTGTVSLTSAERFAARVRARRRRRRAVAALVALLLVALLWLALLSPWTSVRTVEVTGTTRIDAAAVAAVADDELGRAMLLARTDAVAGHVREQQPLAREVEVSRAWPGTLRIAVTERVPVAAVPVAGGKVRLVDEQGVAVETVAKVPAGLPRVEVDLAAPRATQALLECVQVETGLPKALAGKVRKLGAGSPDRVWLELDGGAKVEWGSAEATPRKAEVVLALLDQKADVYDVRSPDNPALKGVDKG